MKRLKKPWILFAGLTFSLSSSQAAPDSITLRDLIARKTVPLSLQAKDLNENYARFHADNAQNANDPLAAIRRAQMGLTNDFANRFYYTKGDTLQLESGTYLVTYAAENRATTPRRFDDGGQPLPAAELPKLRFKDKLQLSLLDLKNLGNLTEFQLFDAENDMESEGDRNRAAVSTLTALGQFLEEWIYDQDEALLPRWKNVVTPEIENLSLPYLQGALWRHPSTDEPFGLNAALAGKNIEEIKNGAQVFMVYERSAAADGSRAVLFADFHVERVEAARWEQLIKSKTAALPAPSESAANTQNLVKLDKDAVLYYLYKKNQAKVAAGQTKTQYYLSKNGRIYYRDAKTHQAIWVAPPKVPIYIPAAQATPYKGLRGYNGSKTGRDLTGLVPTS